MVLSTLRELGDHVCDRLEEPRAAQGGPVFWSLEDEIYPALEEAMCEATLLSGEPEERAREPYSLAKDQQFYPTPPEAVILLRLEGPAGSVLRRATLTDLDRMIPGWQSHRGPRVQYWFSFGMSRFGVYPRLTAPAQVIATYVKLPVTASRPLTGAEEIPFQEEYLHGLESYAAHVARLKEGGLEFQESMALYEDFLKAMQELSHFASRTARLRFTRRGGAQAQVVEKE